MQYLISRARTCPTVVAAVTLAGVLGAQALPNGDPVRTVRMVDLNGDGERDRLGVRADGTLVVSLHMGQRVFQEVVQDLPAAHVADVLSADLDGDRLLDLYVVSPGANVALLGDGQGRFRDATIELGLVDRGSGESAELLDLDADGSSDLLLHNADGDVIFWRDPSGPFERDAATPEQPGTNANPTGFVVVAGAPSDDVSTAVAQGASGDSSRTTLSPHFSSGGGGSLASAGGTSSTGPFDGAGAVPWCPDTLFDQATGACGIMASSIPTLGMLYPIGTEWFVDASTGNVGIGTTSPTESLDVDGRIRSRAGGVEFPDGNVQSRAAVELYMDPSEPDQVQPEQNHFFGDPSTWQSFTAGATGVLTRVDMFRYSQGAAGALNIFEGVGTGGNLLSSDSLEAASAPAWQSVSLSTPPAITAGSQYTIEISSSYSQWGITGSDPYSGGQSSFHHSYDHAFRTYVAQPGAPWSPALEMDGSNAVTLATDLRVNGHEILLRDGTDFNHGLGWRGSENPFGGLNVDGPVLYGFSGGVLGSTAGSERVALYWTNDGRIGLHNDNPSYPLHVGTDTSNGNGAHVTTGGTWTNGSSRTWKSNFRELDADEILERLAELPILRWEYTGSDEGDHIGPMAEDFHAAFGLGNTERYISTVDADGVLMAAVQALAERDREYRDTIRELRERVEELEAR